MLSELRTNLEYYLREWLRIEELFAAKRFRGYSLESIDDILQTAERIAADCFEPFNHLIDAEPPFVKDGEVVLPEATHNAWQSLINFGFIGAAHDVERGGQQLPRVAEFAVTALFAAAAIGMSPDGLTAANASLLIAYGSEKQKRIFAFNENEGKWSGTMCLSEPQAGSSLSDLLTKAVPDGDDFAEDPLGPRYRLSGSKMWISGGEHTLTENIVHLVLAKTVDEDGQIHTGTKQISLFVVPKVLVDLDGTLTEHNDVSLIGLNHKMGYRGLPNTSLSFGDGSYLPLGRAGAVGYLVGEPGDGLRQMFHMMNAFRIKVGVGAAALGYAGFQASLEYALSRVQGRPIGPGGKDTSSPQVAIVEHADVKRMLLAQKSYSEGALALVLYAARLLDEQKTGDDARARRASLILEVLTPVVKSWPSEWCLEANNLAIQVLGGVGYTSEFPVEQFWRDNRLNMIHEGTHGIQALDLLGRKVISNRGEGLLAVIRAIEDTIEIAGQNGTLAPTADQLRDAVEKVRTATKGAWETDDPSEALANATPYMQGFGHVIIAWIWLDVVARTWESTSPLVDGKRAAMAYFFAYELPKIDAWLDVARARVRVCIDTESAWL